MDQLRRMELFLLCPPMAPCDDAALWLVGLCQRGSRRGRHSRQSIAKMHRNQTRSQWAASRRNNSRDQPSVSLSARRWRAIDLNAPAHTWASDYELSVAAKSMDAECVRALPPEFAAILARCFQLTSNASCTRVVGDRQMTTDRVQGFAPNGCDAFYRKVGKSTLEVRACDQHEFASTELRSSAAHECAAAAMAAWIGPPSGSRTR